MDFPGGKLAFVVEEDTDRMTGFDGMVTTCENAWEHGFFYLSDFIDDEELMVLIDDYLPCHYEILQVFHRFQVTIKIKLCEQTTYAKFTGVVDGILPNVHKIHNRVSYEYLYHGRHTNVGRDVPGSW